MSIKAGRDWGERSEKPADLVYFATDWAAAQAIAEARRNNEIVPRIGLTGGDLHRTLGGVSGGGLSDATHATHVTVDLGAALLDGQLHWFIAHLVARRSWLRGRIIVAANAAFLGDWNIAPRAHPGDGRLEVLDGSLTFGDRLKARKRLPSGTHIPHPAIATSRVGAFQLELSYPIGIYLDGHRVTLASKLSIRIEPDAVEVWL